MCNALLTLIRALVISKPDYCNSVLAGISGHLLMVGCNPSSMWNIFAVRRSEHVTSLLRDLDWLRMPQRITYKLCVLVYRCLPGTAPSYLANCLHLASDVAGRQKLRSAAAQTLVVPASATRRSSLGDRFFYAAAPSAWNSLPPAVRCAPTLMTFQRHLKTFLFRALIGHDYISPGLVLVLGLLLLANIFIDFVKCPCNAFA